MIEELETQVPCDMIVGQNANGYIKCGELTRFKDSGGPICVTHIRRLRDRYDRKKAKHARQGYNDYLGDRNAH